MSAEDSVGFAVDPGVLTFRTEFPRNIRQVSTIPAEAPAQIPQRNKPHSPESDLKIIPALS